MENRQNEERYYIPKASDLYIGYKCDVDFGDTSKHMVLSSAGKLKLIVDYLSKINPPYAQVRTKFLDREDVESLGWKWLGQTTYAKTIMKNVEGIEDSYEYALTCYEKNVRIHKKYSGMIFDGFIPSINELRKIMEYLGIETK